MQSARRAEKPSLLLAAVSTETQGVIAIAHEAAELLDRELGWLESRAKGDSALVGEDLVTNADLALEALIVRRLEENFPGDTVLGEERWTAEAARQAQGGRCWVIDPLDGTVNTAVGLPFRAISIALLEDGMPRLGVIHDPLHGETFHAERGGGAFLGERRLPLDPGVVRPFGVSSGLLRQLGETAGMVDALRRFGKLRILGSQALHLVYVAAGRLGAAANAETRVWDDAAGALVVMESGIEYTDFRGRPRFPVDPESPWWAGSKGSSLAAPGALHGEIVALLEQLPEAS